MKLKSSLFIISLIIFFTFRYSTADIIEEMSFLPTGEYNIESTGCFRDSSPHHLEFKTHHYSRHPSVDAPLLTTAMLDYENMFERKLKVSTTSVVVSLKSNDCEINALYKIIYNRNGLLEIQDGKVYNFEPNRCTFSKNIFDEVLLFDKDYFLMRGILFNFDLKDILKLKMRKEDESFYLLHSPASNLTVEENLEFDPEDFQTGDFELDTELEYLEVCSPTNTLSWKLNKLRKKN